MHFHSLCEVTVVAATGLALSAEIVLTKDMYSTQTILALFLQRSRHSHVAQQHLRMVRGLGHLIAPCGSLRAGTGGFDASQRSASPQSRWTIYMHPPQTSATICFAMRCAAPRCWPENACALFTQALSRAGCCSKASAS